jgi:hypothetical protein
MRRISDCTGLIIRPSKFLQSLKTAVRLASRSALKIQKKSASTRNSTAVTACFWWVFPGRIRLPRLCSTDKKLLQFEQDSVDKVRIAGKGKDLELRKEGNNWKLEKPIDGNAENSEVESLIRLIQLGRAVSFPEPSVDAKTAGLSPAATITLHDHKANVDRVLLIGKTAETDKYYAQDSSRTQIFIIDKQIPLKAALPVLNWRDRSIAKTDGQTIYNGGDLQSPPPPQPPPVVPQQPSALRK